jgi:NAD(P)-dependent dehydrogenase (short-subunit alcohol dehydrogenase family)
LQVFQVNYLAGFVLTNLLVSKLKNAGGQARVISLSSLMHQYDKNGIQFDDLKWEKTKV